MQVRFLTLANFCCFFTFYIYRVCAAEIADNVKKRYSTAKESRDAVCIKYDIDFRRDKERFERRTMVSKVNHFLINSSYRLFHCPVVQ